MRYDSLHAPVSESEPCGPDLDETGDDAYANYMLLASGRLPSKFFDINRETGEEAPFDKASIDLDDELEAIDGFLKRSRDIRLLTLEARFQILTGSIIGFSEAVQGPRHRRQRILGYLPAAALRGRQHAAAEHGRGAGRSDPDPPAVAICRNRERRRPDHHRHLPQLHRRQRQGQAAQQGRSAEARRRGKGAARWQHRGAGQGSA